MSLSRLVVIWVSSAVRQFWDRFTSSDIAYAPDPLRIDPTGADYSAPHRPASWDADLFHVAHLHLQRTLVPPGPPTWSPCAARCAPCAVIEAELPDISRRPRK